MAHLYRRAADSNIWHWCPNCSAWPTQTDAVERTELPPNGLACTECFSRDTKGTCDD